jgi:UDP-N-acetylglucosamine:LPS N-acetylglucosamine transferase
LQLDICPRFAGQCAQVTFPCIKARAKKVFSDATYSKGVLAEMNKKPRVLFPYTEAGLGHIMPMNSIADEFEKLYGEKVECVRSRFFTESNNEDLQRYEQHLANSVVAYNKKPFLGFFATFNMDFWGTKISSWGAVTYIEPGASEAGIAHMKELNPDLVVSTHWATNYYAMHCENRPLTAMYCPDAKINTLFRYPCDLSLTSMPTGYKRARKIHGRRYTDDNIKLVPFLIRNEAFQVSMDKKENRRKAGLDENKFTVLLADGGYGVGKMQPMVEELLKRDLPITVIAVCGKNQELYEYFLSLKSKGKTDFRPMGLVDNMLELIACADVCCGKSGASMMAEPCFFGVPEIITHYATDIERWIGKYYLKTVGSALKIFKPKKAVDKIEEFMKNPKKLEPYRKAALSQHDNYGAEKCARYIFGLLCTRFPELKDGTELM